MTRTKTRMGLAPRDATRAAGAPVRFAGPAQAGADAALPAAIATLRPTRLGGGAPPTPEMQISVALMGTVTRSTGLFGDSLMVSAKIADWRALQGSLGQDALYEITFGVTGKTVTLGGYALRAPTPTGYGRDIGEPESIDPHPTAVTLEFATKPALWRGGRGGLLRKSGGAINPLGRDGLPDPLHPNYLGNLDLIAECLYALGLPVSVSAGGAELDALKPPGPLDWGNARPLAEMDIVCDHCGAGAALRNDGNGIIIFRLGRAGDDIDIPADMLAIAEPFELSYGPAVRGRTIVVTSGQTRTTVVTSRDLSEAGGLEWVWFDEKSGRWLNDAETAVLYPGAAEHGAGDIEAFRAGPDPKGTVESKARFERLFRAVRLKVSERDAISRLVPLASGVTLEAPVGDLELPGGIVACAARFAGPRPGSQFVNEPTGDGDAPAPLVGARAHPEEGVFEFPFALVRMGTADGVGGYADARALVDGDLTVVFAHESATGRHTEDYYVRGFKSDNDGVVTPLTAVQLEAALTDATTTILDAEFLARVCKRPQGLPAADPGTFVNDAILDAAALSIAKARADAGLAQTGAVPLRGMVNIEPGAWGGVVTSMTWDPRAMLTIVRLNEHDEPDGVMDELAAAAGRSFDAGLSRYSLPGSMAGAVSVRAGTTGLSAFSRGASGGAGTSRGAEATVPAAVKAAPRSPARTGVENKGERMLAKITGAESVGANRWKYAWSEAALDASGALTVHASGRTSATHGVAFNLAEGANDGVGVEGNGIDRASLPAGWEMQPIAERFVELIGPFGDPGAPHYLFSATNADDGECPGEEDEADGANGPGAVRTADDVLLFTAMMEAY